MNRETYEKIVETQLQKCEDVLLMKSREYATDDDMLHNFNVAAELKGETPQQALAGFMAKHTVSVYDMCQAPDGKFTMEKWDEKITDHINYLILLKAVVHQSVWDGEHIHQPTITGGVFTPSVFTRNIDTTP